MQLKSKFRLIKNIFHGFPRIGEGGHRKTINIAFLKDNIKD